MFSLKSLLLASAVAALPTLAVADDPTWVADFDKAVALAKSSHKDLFIDFTGSDW